MNRLGGIAAAPGIVAALLGWWLGQLRALLPGGLRGLGGRVLLDLRDGSARVLRVGGRTARHLGTLDLAEPASGRPGRRLRDLGVLPICVPEDWMVRLTLRLPEAAEARLDAVLRFELEQHLPFAARDVVWTARIRRRLADQRRIEVEAAVLPRTKIAAVAAALRAGGIKARLIAQPAPEAGWPAIALDAVSPPGRRWQSWAAAGLSLAAALLCAGIALAHIEAGRDRAAALEARAAVALGQAAGVQAREDEAARLRARLALAAELRAARPPAVAVLEEVARRLPDEAWLTEFRLDGDRLVVSGFAVRAEALITLLDASPMLREVRFASPVTRDRPDAPERFQIAMRVAAPVQRLVAVPPPRMVAAP